jgi:hypothetical protein
MKKNPPYCGFLETQDVVCMPRVLSLDILYINHTRQECPLNLLAHQAL